MNENDKQNDVEKPDASERAAETTETPPRPPRRRRRLLRRLLIALIGIAVLLVAAVFYLKSEHGIRHFIVPRVEKRLGRTITFDRLKIRLLRGAAIEGLTIGPAAGELQPLLQLDKLAVEWNVKAFLRRRVDLRNVATDGLRVSLVEQPKQTQPKPPKPPSKKKEQPRKGEGREPSLLVQKLQVTNTSVEWVRLGPDRRTVASRYAVRDIAIEGSQLALGRPAKLDLRARIEAEDASQGVSLSDGQIAFQANSEMSAAGDKFTLGGAWSVDRLKGRFHGVAAQDLRATGSLVLEQSDPRRLVIKRADLAMFYQKRRGLDLSLSGELNPATGDGHAEASIAGINRDFLNLLSTAQQPLDFRSTTLGGQLTLETYQQHSYITVESNLQLKDFSVLAPQITSAPTPLTQLHLQGKTAYDTAQKKLGLERLNVRALQEGRETVLVTLTNPMTFSLQSGSAITTAAAAELNVKINSLALSQFNPFLGRKAMRIESGKLSVDSALSIAGAGQSVAARGRVDLADLLAVVSGTRTERTNIQTNFDLLFGAGAFSIKTLRCDVQMAGKPAGHIEGRGEIATDGQKGQIVLAADRVDLSALQVFLADLPSVKPRAGLVSFSEKIAFAGAQQPAQFDGQFSVANLNFDLPDRQGAQFRDWSVQGRNLVRFDRTKQTADITTLSLTIGEKAVGGLQAGVGGQINPKQGAGTLNLAVRNADVPFLLSVVNRLGGKASAGPQPTAGALSCAAQVKFDKQFADLAVKGNLQSRGMRWAAGGGKPAQTSVPDLDASYDVALARTKDRNELTIQNLLLRVVRTGAQLGALSLNGRIDLAKNEGTVALSADAFETEPLWPLLAALNIDVPVTSGRLNAKQNLRYALGTATIEAEGNLRADAVRIRSIAGTTPTAPLTIGLTNNVALSADKTDVRVLQLSTFSAGKPLDQLEIKAQGGGLRSNKPITVTLNAPTLHADPYLAIAAAASKKEKSEAPKPAPTVVSSPAPPSGGGKSASVAPIPPILATVGIGKFYFDRLLVENIASTIRLTSQGVTTVKPLSARLFGGSATVNGSMRTDKSDMPYSARVHGENVDVASLLAYLSPGSEKKLTGKGTTTLDVAGHGFDPASLRRDLLSSGSLQLTDGQMKEIPILSALASITGVESLSDVRFFRVDAQWNLAKGVIDIPNAFLVGKLQKIRAKGKVDFDQKVDLTFDLWLGGELQDRLRGQKYFKYLVMGTDKFLRLPFPVGMGGTLSKPRPTLKLPVESILDIGIEQGLKLLREGEGKRKQ